MVCLVALGDEHEKIPEEDITLKRNHIGGSLGGSARLARGRELCHPGLSSWVGVLRPNQLNCSILLL